MWKTGAVAEGHAQDAGLPAVRATDADRDEVVAKLKRALDVGALQFDEIETRLGAVYAARTRRDLDGLTEDLPQESAGATSRSKSRRDRPSAFDVPTFRIHAIVYVLVIAMLVGIWAMAGRGGGFWPFFPAAGWGVGLGAHYGVASEAARKRARKRDRAQRRSAAVPAAKALASGPSRTFVAAMFADVVGSTELNEAIGDSQWSRERARFRAAVNACAGAEGGREVNAAGDGVLVRFHSPAAAVRAATSLQRVMADRRDEGFAPEISIGIHSGDVIDEGDDILGSVINMAARVGEVAGSGEIVITEHVADHASDASTTDFGLHHLKGVAQPRHLLRVSWSDSMS